MSSALRPLEVRCSGSAPAASSRRTISVSLGKRRAVQPKKQRCVCPCGKGILLEEKDTTETSHLKINGAVFEISLTYICVIAMDYV